MRDVGYLELLRSNANYRRIWLGDVASLLGDWFNTIALYTLVQRLTGSPLALGLVFLTKMVPFALASPLAGLLVDRLNRRRLMIATDLLRAIVVLGFLLVEDSGDLPLLYLLAALQILLSAAFIPARSASIPNITSREELLTANALSAATWSTLLAIGAALGGLAAEVLGLRAVFLLDSLSYCVSAAFILRTRIPQETVSSGKATLRTALADIVAGWRHVVARPPVARMVLVKASWSLGGGALVYLLASSGDDLFAGSGAVGIGLLFAARGLGTGLGPIAARAWVPQESRWPPLMGTGIVASGVAYLSVAALVGRAPGSPAALTLVVLFVILAHAFSGANWTLSTVQLQKRTVDAFRGRVFATEWLLLTLVDAIAILAASLLLEIAGLPLAWAFALFAGIQVATGLVFFGVVVPRERAAVDGRGGRRGTDTI